MTSKKKSGQRETEERGSFTEQLRSPMRAIGQLSHVEMAFALAAAVVLVAIVWAEPRPIGDYYIALAAGRDMVNSQFACLTQPDTWSFVTTGRVWLNQNWLTHLIYYLTYDMVGELGSLALKALVLAAMAVFIVMVCRERQVVWPIAILTSGCAVAAGRNFIDLRPNLMTFMFVPLVLWLLYRTRIKPHRAWMVLLVLAAWANFHGGFLFGLGMIVLWTLCWLVTLWACKGLKAVLRRDWPVLAAAAAGVVASGTLTPFGIANLTHPFVVGSSPEWRSVAEWFPIYEWTWFGSTWEFYVAMALLVVGPVMCGLVLLKREKGVRLQLQIEQLGPLVFSACLCITLFILANAWQVRPDVMYESLRRDRQIVLFVAGIVGLVGSLVTAVIFVGLAKGKHRLSRPGAEELATLIFELCLAAIIITMAIKARRFIPLAVILVAPMVAYQVQWLLQASRQAWPVILVAAALLVSGLFPLREFYKYYHPNNPMLPSHTMFQRMMVFGNYPSGAADFINANNLDKRAFNEWKWEGFLHWRCPQLKVFMGGRAQQIYSLQTYETWRRIVKGTKNLSELRKLGAHLAVVPLSFRYRPLIGRLVDGPHASWAYIYFDGRNAVLSDADWAETKELIDRAATGQLKYPDSGIAGLSRMKCLSSKVVGKGGFGAVKILMEANALKPTPLGYNLLKTELTKVRVPPKMLISYWERLSSQLEKMGVHCSGGFDVLACRHMAAEALLYLYGHVGEREQARRWAAVAAGIREEAAAMKDKWEARPALFYYPHLFFPRRDVPHARRG